MSGSCCYFFYSKEFLTFYFSVPSLCFKESAVNKILKQVKFFRVKKITTNITLVLKSDTDITKEEYYISISLVNIDANFFNKMLAN